jgi:hypothetical protein
MTHGNVFRFHNELFLQQFAGNGAHGGRAEARQVDQCSAADGAQVVDHVQDDIFALGIAIVEHNSPPGKNANNLIQFYMKYQEKAIRNLNKFKQSF